MFNKHQEELIIKEPYHWKSETTFESSSCLDSISEEQEGTQIDSKRGNSSNILGINSSRNTSKIDGKLLENLILPLRREKSNTFKRDRPLNHVNLRKNTTLPAERMDEMPNNGVTSARLNPSTLVATNQKTANRGSVSA